MSHPHGHACMHATQLTDPIEATLKEMHGEIMSLRQLLGEKVVIR